MFLKKIQHNLSVSVVLFHCIVLDPLVFLVSCLHPNINVKKKKQLHIHSCWPPQTYCTHTYKLPVREKLFFFWPGHRDQVRGLGRSSARTFEGPFSDVVSKQWLQDTQWFKWAWAGSSSLFLESLQTDTREGGWTQVKELCWRQFISLII